MCGRFSLVESPETVESVSEAGAIEAFPPRYNIAPTQPILMIWQNLDGKRASGLVRWGLVPAWVKDPAEFTLLTNARCETAADKPSFRNAMRHRRTLVPASGFYEWHRPSDKSLPKQPYYVRPKNGGVIFFAGLLESWADASGSEIDTGCILTCQANASFAKIHHRLPVVVQPQDFELWLDCASNEPRDIAHLLHPADEDFFETIPVSQKVNSVANAGPEIQEECLVEVTPNNVSSTKAKKHEAKSQRNQLDLF